MYSLMRNLEWKFWQRHSVCLVTKITDSSVFRRTYNRKQPYASQKNPDVFELIRAKSARIQSLPNELTLLTNNLPSVYHRDFQLTKEIIFPGIQDLKDCLSIFEFMLKQINVKEDILKDEKYDYLFSVEKINELVMKGASFREAYREVGNSIENGTYHYRNDDLRHTHKGSIGNLCLDEISAQFEEIFQKFT